MRECQSPNEALLAGAACVECVGELSQGFCGEMPVGEGPDGAGLVGRATGSSSRAESFSCRVDMRVSQKVHHQSIHNWWPAWTV